MNELNDESASAADATAEKQSSPNAQKSGSESSGPECTSEFPCISGGQMDQPVGAEQVSAKDRTTSVIWGPGLSPGLKFALANLFLALVPMVVWPWWDDSVETPKLAFSWAFVSLASLLCLISPPERAHVSRTRLAVSSSGWLCLSTGLYCLLFAVQGNGDGWDSVLKWITALLTGLALGWLVNFRPERLQRLSSGMVWGWLLTAGYSWCQRLGLDPIHWSRPDLSQVRTIAGLGNPNHLGLHIAMVAPLALSWLVLRPKSTANRLIGMVGWSLACSVIWYSGTRASVLAFSLSMLIFGLLTWRNCAQQLRWFCYSLATMALVIFVWYSVPSSQTNEFQSWKRVASIAGRPDESSQTRLLLWRAAMQQVSQAPFGQGAGWFGYRYLFQRDPEPEALRVANRRPEHPHNFYLEIQLDGGILTLCSWLLSVGIALRVYLQGSKTTTSKANGPDELNLCIPLSCSLIAMLVNVSFISLTLTSTIFVVWLSVLSHSLQSSGQAEEPTGLQQGWLAKVLLTVGTFVGLLLSLATCHHESLAWLADDQIYPFRNAPVATPAPAMAVQQSLDYSQQAESSSPPWSRKRQIRQLAELYGFGSFSFQQNGDARFAKLDDRAVYFYHQASQNYPYDSYTWSGLAHYLERNLTEQRLTVITDAYQKAHQLDPFNLNFALDLSRWHWRLGQYDQSLQVCEEALSKAPHSESAKVHRALCLHSLGKTQEAESVWQEILKSHEGDPLKKPW